MKPAHLVRFDAVAPQRWRNGGGWTRELLALPAADDWRVRVSVADIDTDGPFSPFPGVERHFAVLEGDGVVLRVDGTEHRVVPGGPAVTFAGDAATTCRRVGGPTRDLNLMVRGGGGLLRPVVANQAWVCPASAGGLFATAAGRCRQGDARIEVPALALVWFDEAPGTLVFDASGWWLAA